MEATIRVPAGPERLSMLGAGERNLKMLREALGVSITSREGAVMIQGERDGVAIAQRVLSRLAAAGTQGRSFNRRQLLNTIADEADVYASELEREEQDSLAETESTEFRHAEPWDGTLQVYVRGRQVRAKTGNQQRYLEAIRDHDLVFGLGPAGTGKTYLAVAAAVHLLKSDQVRKLILVRPAVEAGEKLGFLPGDLEDKVNPYLRPLLDALHDMMEFATIRRFMETDVVEVVPLAFMRGRTLNNAVIILDEAQNTTRAQMKMFLTRMGHGSKMIVTGDVTQIDLPDPSDSGLIDAVKRLAKTDGVAFGYLDRTDVVRHPIVQKVIDAYGDDGKDR